MNKGKTIIVWILIIVLLGVIGYCGYRIYDKLNSNNTETNSNKQNNTEEKNNIEEKEVELTVETVKADVLDKLNMILGLNRERGILVKSTFDLSNNLAKADRSDKVFFDFLLPQSNEKTNILNNEQKLKLALFNSGSGMTEVSENKEISLETLKTRYKALFNEEIEQFDDVCIAWYCYKYDQTKNVYYESSTMIDGASGGSGIISYINAINYVNDFVYVYINFGSYEVDFQGGGNKCYVVDGVVNYDDKMNYDNPIFVGKYGYDNVNDKVIYECEDFKIDESNYKEFTNYKFTFKKNSEGTYYFDKVEKVEN